MKYRLKNPYPAKTAHAGMSYYKFKIERGGKQTFLAVQDKGQSVTDARRTVEQMIQTFNTRKV